MHGNSLLQQRHRRFPWRGGRRRRVSLLNVFFELHVCRNRVFFSFVLTRARPRLSTLETEVMTLALQYVWAYQDCIFS